MEPAQRISAGDKKVCGAHDDSPRLRKLSGRGNDMNLSMSIT